MKQTTNHKPQSYISKFLILFFLVFALSNCQEEEEAVKPENQASGIYKNEIDRYLETLKLNVNKKQLDKIDELITTIDIKSLKSFTLESTQKILIADVKPLKGLETANKTKALFFLNQDKIVRFRVITFTNKTTFNDYDNVILSVWNKNKNKKLYSGIVSFYNPYQERLLSNEFENGTLKVNGVLSLKINKSTNKRTKGCTDWYWVTSYQDGTQISEYLYTTCNSCEEMAYKTKNDCGGGGGGGSSTGGTGSGPKFPFSPNNEDTYDYFSPEGEHVRYQYIANIWKIILISLPDVVVKAVPESRPYLVFNWPQDQQKAAGEGFLFNYDSGSSTWTGVPATNALIAQTIEDQIDDSKLDPCTKGVLDKLRNSTQSDIAAMLTHFSPAKSIFNINMTIGQVNDNNPNVWAQTTKVSGSSTGINMVFNQDYINGTGNINRPTDLSIATTMAHEVIHAYLISLLEQNLACGSAAICDFPTVYEAYVQQKITKDDSILPDAHHELIASNYVYAIASAIEEFHTGQPVGSSFPRQVYLDMALGGLTGTTFFNKNYPNNPNHKNYNDRIRIFARINTEKLGSQYGINTPLGTPCKK